jgi:uncharacterized linocin/CFP29 family protein
MKEESMNLLKRELAPITDKAWEEINEQSREVFKSDLSIRKFADVTGPHGLDMGAVPGGRLTIPKNQDKKEILYGIQQVQPLVEVRSSFTLDLWELDNVERGAGDIDLDALEKAAKRIAAFEESTIFNGLKSANIKGLKNNSEHEVLAFPTEPSHALHAVTEAVAKLKQVSVEGPYSLVLDTDKWEMVSSYLNGYPLRSQLENVLGGSLIFAPNLEGAMVVSTRGGDLELTLGQDLSIGYETHDKNEVKMYFTEAFTFRIHDPAAFIFMK